MTIDGHCCSFNTGFAYMLAIRRAKASGASGRGNRLKILKSLGIDSSCCSCGAVPGKLLIISFLCLLSSDWCLVVQKLVPVWLKLLTLVQEKRLFKQVLIKVRLTCYLLVELISSLS